MSSEIGAAPTPPIWDEWGRITRFLESARLAFARERNLWASLELGDDRDVQLSASAGDGVYKVGLHQHLAAIEDEQTLLASVLIHSYALAESAAASHLSVDSRDFRGIEDWGGRLLSRTNRSWDKVHHGLAGAVEVAVVRNAYAHGTRHIDEASEKRLRKVGVLDRTAGQTVSLDHAELRTFRARLRSLLRWGGFGRPS